MRRLISLPWVGNPPWTPGAGELKEESQVQENKTLSQVRASFSFSFNINIVDTEVERLRNLPIWFVQVRKMPNWNGTSPNIRLLLLNINSNGGGSSRIYGDFTSKRGLD